MNEDEALEAAVNECCTAECVHNSQGACQFPPEEKDACPTIDAYLHSGHIRNISNINNIMDEKTYYKIADAIRDYLLDEGQDVIDSLHIGVDTSGIAIRMARYIKNRLN